MHCDKILDPSNNDANKHLCMFSLYIIDSDGKCRPLWLYLYFRRSYAASLGEIAVAFDFGPLVDAPRHLASLQLKEDLLVYPLYILYGNGETFLSYTSLTYT